MVSWIVFIELCVFNIFFLDLCFILFLLFIFSSYWFYSPFCSFFVFSLLVFPFESRKPLKLQEIRFFGILRTSKNKHTNTHTHTHKQNQIGWGEQQQQQQQQQQQNIITATATTVTPTNKNTNHKQQQQQQQINNNTNNKSTTATTNQQQQINNNSKLFIKTTTTTNCLYKDNPNPKNTKSVVSEAVFWGGFATCATTICTISVQLVTTKKNRAHAEK